MGRHRVILVEHLLQRQLEHLVASRVDQRIDANVEETKRTSCLQPLIR